MKRLILILAMATGAIGSFAQSGLGGKNHAIFMFNNPGDPKEVYRLGMDPEFPFLRNLSTRQAVVSAMQRAQHDSRYTRQARELNELLMAAGFARGIKDVTVASVTSYQVDPGTTGNMGSGKFTYMYSKIETGETVNAWKVTSDNGGYIAFLSPCGNAFYPGAYVAPPALSTLDLLPITAPSDTLAMERPNAYTGEKPKEECDPCKPKCDCECDPCEHYYYHRHYRRMHRWDGCCGW